VEGREVAAETEEIKSCFYCGMETTALIKNDTKDWICGYCFIFNWCMACGPNRYDQEFVKDMRKGLEDFIRVIRLREEPQRG